MDTKKFIDCVEPTLTLSYQEFKNTLEKEYRKKIMKTISNFISIAIVQDENFNIMQRQAICDFVNAQKMAGDETEYKFSTDKTRIGNIYGLEIAIHNPNGFVLPKL